jgi:tRNA threonylcarbamoyladenosine biosynthesis protein TsaB
MILVAVDTSTRWAGVGLQLDSGERTQMIWRSDQNHGRELMPAIVELMFRANLRPPDITHLAVALGPGGFSAVRVGISAVIGLAMPNDLPVAGVPTHSIEVLPFLESASSETPVVSLIPAGRNEVAWAQFDQPDSTVAADTGLAAPGKLGDLLPSSALFCGEAAEMMTDFVEAERILVDSAPTRSPIALLELASASFDDRNGTSPTVLKPIYARSPSITMQSAPK